MPSVRVKHVEQYVDRHGKVRIYYRNRTRGGKRVPLRGPIGSAEFWEDYLQAHEAPPDDAPPRLAKGSMTWLVQQYYRSADFRQLSERTRYVRRRTLTRFLDDHGDKRYEKLEPRHIRAIRDDMADRPEAANGLLKILRQVFRYAVEYDMAERNPLVEVGYIKTKSAGHRPWTPEDVSRYEEAHPVGTKGRLALALLLYTGQRRGDIVRLGRQHERDDWLHFTQEKTGAEMAIPIFRELREILDASPTGDLTYLVTGYGKPFTSNGFGNWFRRQCDAAGLEGLTAHGIRKTVGSLLAEAGHSPHEIAAIGGWQTLKEVERYTRAANRKMLAGRVRDRRESG